MRKLATIDQIIKKFNGTYTDSVGNGLLIDDYVLAVGYDKSKGKSLAYLGIVGKPAKDMIRHYDTKEPIDFKNISYLFKVWSKEDVDRYIKWRQTVDVYIDSFGIQKKGTLKADYLERCREDLYRNKFETLRGMPMYDCLNRELKVGDLVLYLDKDKGGVYSYGVVISETHIFNAMGEKKRVHQVCLRRELIQTESIIQKKLYNMSQGVSVEGNKVDIDSIKTDYKFGDVCKSRMAVYIYLGKIDLSIEPVATSNIFYDYKIDESKDYWLACGGLDEGDIRSLMNNSAEFSKVLWELLGMARCEDAKYNLKSFLEMYYKRCVGLPYLKDKMTDDVKYVGNLGISQKVYEWSRLSSDLKTFKCKLIIK